MKTKFFIGCRMMPVCYLLLVLMALYSFAPAHPPSYAMSTNKHQTQEPITGIVSDAGGPIPGVIVQVKGSGISTITDELGYYSIQATPGDILVFTYPGYETMEIIVGDELILDVEIFESITHLEEAVINAGYYTVKDKERTGSISRVTAEEIENQPVGNVLAAVQGRMAGVNITQSSGIPGSGFEVQIRGVNSLRRDGNYPLYIVDGVPLVINRSSTLSGAIIPYADINPLNSINPRDIQSIEILKDADATAIYGSRGANGVILITTKKGQKGQTNIHFNSSYSVSKVARKMEMMNAQQYLNMRQQAFANSGITEYPANAYDVNGTWDTEKETDWQKELVGRNAASTSYAVSLDGGGNSFRYLFSIGQNEMQTVISDNFRYKTNNFLGSVNYTAPNKKLEVNSTSLFTIQRNNVVSQDFTSQMLRLSPVTPSLYNQDGSLNWENNTFTNPVADFESTYNNESTNFNLSLNFNYKFTDSFNFKINSGLTQNKTKEQTLRPHTIYNPAYGLTSYNSSAFKNNSDHFSILVEPQLNFKYIVKDLQMEVLLGSTYQQSNYTSIGVEGFGFESNSLITNISAAQSVSISQDSKSDYRYLAAFGRIHLNYKDRYLLNLTGRRDGSSRFGTNNRFSNFGAIGAAWLFSREEFLVNNSWLSHGKLRLSIGTSGNDLIGDYQYLDSYTIGNTFYGGGSVLLPSNLYNPDYSWEKTVKKEIAIELGFLRDRIGLIASWYDNRSGNQLVGVQMPATTGFNNVLANLPATVQNKGFELELNLSVIKTKEVEWYNNFNISFPKNKLLSFPNLEGSTYANKYIVGQPLNIALVYNYQGIDPETGQYIFQDYNGDGIISNPDDKLFIENVGVKYFGGWQTNLRYRNLDFSFLFQFVKQRKFTYLAQTPTPGSFNNQPVELLNIWSEENPNGVFMPYTSSTNPLHNLLRESNAAIGDASFIRLKNVQLTYKLPLNENTFKELQIYFHGQNLLTITKYFGLDPEFSLSGYLPPLKTYALGVQLKF